MDMLNFSSFNGDSDKEGNFHYFSMKTYVLDTEAILMSTTTYGPRQANLVLIAYASREGSGESAHLRCLTRTSDARSYKQ